MLKKINKEQRQRAIIESLMQGPKTMAALEEAVALKLKLDLFVPEATRNRDLRDLRNKGYEIELCYGKYSEPEYILKRTKIELDCYATNVSPVMAFLKLGLDLGLLLDEHVAAKVKEYSELLGAPVLPFRIDGLKKFLSLSSHDLKLIEKAINKKCSIKFMIKQPSDSKIKTVTAFPKEIFIQDKFIYLSVKRKSLSGNSFEWREYRLDRFIPLEKSNCISINTKDIDPSPDAKHEPTYLKILVLPPLMNFFDYEMYGLQKIGNDAEGYQIYEGNIYKPKFRIIKDFLALLPHVRILGGKDIVSEFDLILKKSLSTLTP